MLLAFLCHWLLYPVVGLLIFCASCIIGCIINPFAWLPFGLYFLFILFTTPTFAEIAFWKWIRELFLPIMQSRLAVYNNAFPAKIVGGKSADSGGSGLQSKPTMYVFHPHGLLSLSRIIHTFDKSSPIYEHIHNAYHAVHSVLFKIPFIRELVLFAGMIPAEKAYMEHYLKNGDSITITPGGVREMNYAQTGGKTDKVYLHGRRGFTRLAVKMAVPMQPIYSWGEQDIITFSSPWFSFFNRVFSAVTGYSFNVDAFQALFPRNLGRWNAVWNQIRNVEREDKEDRGDRAERRMRPRPSGTTTYMGQLIYPSKSVDDTHTAYIGELKELYNLARDEQGSSRELTVL